MPKVRWPALLVGLALAACAAKKSSAPAIAPPRAVTPSPEEDPQAPGMIPQECEALLNRSRDWGFLPEKSWKPASAEQALKAAEFFATFHLVPESTSTFARAWMAEPAPSTAAQAQRRLDRMDRAQSCDVLLAHKLLLSLLKFRWPRKLRAVVGRDFRLFVLGQQERVATSVARAVQIDVLAKAVRGGFVHARASEVESLRKWFDERTAEGLRLANGTTDAIAQWKLNREELRVSEEARERLEKLLPK